MDREFHYYIMYYLARKAGLSENDCYLLSYSNQMTDDNTSVYKIKSKKENYENYISQTMNILKPQNKLMRIYLCFHFIPGDYQKSCAYRKDGKLHLLTTTPNSTLAQDFLLTALRSKNIYRIGIATHAYADSWAHQNFVGCNDYVNSNKQILGLLIPNIGHADFIQKPDIVSLTWKDKRLIPSHQEINNQERVLSAAKHIFLILTAYSQGKEIQNLDDIVNNKNDSSWQVVEKELKDALGPVFTFIKNSIDLKNKRMEGYNKLLKNNFEQYESTRWFNEAVDIHVKGLKDKPVKFGQSSFIPDVYTMKENFESSHWYKFQEAVKEHQAYAKEKIKPRIEQMEFVGF
ncbi:MAG: hypothetical protein JXJ04_02210 [Spirochaetales bacterium]|nr:hypothetical protein [Spirochaetales bacterium]